MLDDLFEGDRCLDRDIRLRLAFREFGAAMGIRCVAEQEAEKDRAVDLKVYADRIVDCWTPYMMGAEGEEDELRPITQVMYASALIPGGELQPLLLLLLLLPQEDIANGIAFQRGFFGPEPVIPERTLYE